MAGPYYVHDGGSNTSPYDTWAKAATALGTVTALAAAGEIIYVSKDHTETLGAAGSYIFAGTAANPVRLLVASEADPPVLADAPNTTTYNIIGGTQSVVFRGFAYVYGLSVSANRSTTAPTLADHSTSPGAITFELCAFTQLYNGVNAHISINTAQATGIDDDYAEFIDCTFRFGNAGASIQVGCGRSIIRSTTGKSLILAGGTTPTDLFEPWTTTVSGRLDVIGYDLSTITGNLFNVAGPGYLDIYFRNCKLGAGVVVSSTQPSGPGGHRVFLDNCDSADTNYRMEHFKYQGYIKREGTIKMTSGGASDGTTVSSWRMTTYANATTMQWYWAPLESPPIVTWNETTGSAVTATIEILHDSATNLEDDEIWMEMEHLGTSGFPLALVDLDDKTATPKTSLVSGPGNGSAQAAGVGTGSWTTTGMSNPNSQKLSCTFTPQEKGCLRATVKLAKANYTVYINPLVTLT